MVKFGILTGFAALFLAASVAQSVFWGHDPYSTFWMTTAFRITTIFTLGSVFLSVRRWQSVVLTALPVGGGVDGPLPTVAQLGARVKRKAD